MHKAILVPVKVPDGVYCLDRENRCEHLTEEGTCRINEIFNWEENLVVTKEGFIKKLKMCREL